MNPLVILIGAQVLYTVGDLLARVFMQKYGFTPALFSAPVFWLYFAMRIIATFGQLYVLANVELGKSAALFGATSIILANILSLLILKEVLPPIAYVGASLAVIAFLTLALR